MVSLVHNELVNGNWLTWSSRLRPTFNSSSPSAAYMLQWMGSALAQIMAWYLFGAKPSSEAICWDTAERWAQCVRHWVLQDRKSFFFFFHYLMQCWNIVNWTHGNKLQWNLNQNLYIFIQENASENVVCEIAAILSRGTWINWLIPWISRLDFKDTIFQSYFTYWYLQIFLW